MRTKQNASPRRRPSPHSGPAHRRGNTVEPLERLRERAYRRAVPWATAVGRGDGPGWKSRYLCIERTAPHARRGTRKGLTAPEPSASALLHQEDQEGSDMVRFELPARGAGKVVWFSVERRAALFAGSRHGRVERRVCRALIDRFARQGFRSSSAVRPGWMPVRGGQPAATGARCLSGGARGPVRHGAGLLGAAPHLRQRPVRRGLVGAPWRCTASPRCSKPTTRCRASTSS